MNGGGRPRRPVRVVILVLAFWIGGNALQALLSSGLASSGLVTGGSEIWIGQVVVWGLLFLVALVYREPLDEWLRRR